MSNKEEKEVILEQYHEFPAGRGKKAFFGTSSTVEPKKRQKRNPKRYCLFRIKANPEHIQLVIYKPRLNNPIFYPNKRRLTRDETNQLFTALILYHLYTYRGQFPINLAYKVANHKQIRITLPRNIAIELNEQVKRFNKWIRKNQK